MIFSRRMFLFSAGLLLPAARAQQPPVVYICPMDPQVRQAAGGKCPVCGMDLVPSTPGDYSEYLLKVGTAPRAIVPGRKVTLRFEVLHPRTSERIGDFAVVHDKLLHLFVLSQDLEYFEHVHPDPQRDGTFVLETVFPRAGRYHLIADLFPEGGTPQTLQHALVTAGFNGALRPAHLKADREWVSLVSGVRAELVRQPLVAGKEVMLLLRLTDTASGQPVTDLEQYLGAWGHMLVVSDDLADAVHVHPAPETRPGGPEIVFDARFPRPGHYRIWTQFQRRSQVLTARYTVRVDRIGAELLEL